jgi:hypothetical protein
MNQKLIDLGIPKRFNPFGYRSNTESSASRDCAPQCPVQT